MRNILFSTCFLLLFHTVKAQRPDTAWGSWPHQVYYDGILDAPVVTGGTTPELITPTGQKLCFDKKIKIKSLISSGPVEQCMYLNTKEGYVGLLPPVRGGGDLCAIKTDDPDFIFYVLGLKGNSYTFRNNKKNGGIEHWVSTGNTQTFQYSFPATGATYTLHKKTERRGYCGDKIKTWAYKYDNPSSPVYYLFGKTFPATITVAERKYIGNFGVGYQFTDKGLFIIMEMVGGSYSCKITELEEVTICFDPAPFKIAEDEMVNKMTASLQREREKIAADEIKANGSECSSEKMAVIQFRKEQLRIQEARVYTSQQGNVYQDLAAQQALGGMFDHVAVTEQTILENKVKICSAQERMQKSRSETSRQGYQDKINCLTNQNAQLEASKEQLKALDIQYVNEPGKALAEKSKLFMRNIPTGCR